LLLATDARDILVMGVGEASRRQREIPLAPRLTEADRAAHREFILTLGGKPIWNDFLPATVAVSPA
jgi:DNA polymerase III subunit epsilon